MAVEHGFRRKTGFPVPPLPRPVPLRHADGGSGGNRKQEGEDLLRSLAALPESVKPMVAQLLTDGATLERGLQTILDGRGRRDPWVEIEVMAGYYEHWMAQVAGLTDACRVARVPWESHAMMMRIFEPMAQRINHLHGQVFEKGN